MVGKVVGKKGTDYEAWPRRSGCVFDEIASWDFLDLAATAARGADTAPEGEHMRPQQQTGARPARPKRPAYPNTCRLIVWRVDFTLDGDERFVVGVAKRADYLDVEASIGDRDKLFELACRLPLTAALRTVGSAPPYEVRIVPWSSKHRGEPWKRVLEVRNAEWLFGTEHDILKQGLWLSTDEARTARERLREEGAGTSARTSEHLNCRLVIVDAMVDQAGGGQFFLEARAGNRRFVRLPVNSAEGLLKIAAKVGLTARLRGSSTSRRFRESPVRLGRYRSGRLGVMTPRGTDILRHGLVELVDRADGKQPPSSAAQPGQSGRAQPPITSEHKHRQLQGKQS